MKKKCLIGVIVILVGLLAVGAWADCTDETNPQCFTCRSMFIIGSWCAIVVGGDTGYCSCSDWVFNGTSWCTLNGEFCGMIIVVG